MKRIAIVTASFAPVSTPRANRATELAKEFARQGYEVVVYTCTSISDKEDYIPEYDNLKVINLNVRRISLSIRHNTSNMRSPIVDRTLIYIRRIVYYFSLGTWLIYLFGLIRNLKVTEKYDMLISIGLPFTIHWGVAVGMARHKFADCSVADYGDPFSKGNKNLKCAFYFRLVEKWVINKFDYITIPTLNALDTYRWLKDDDHIKVIPQGFNFSEIKLRKYVPNKLPTFMYAGIFYSDIRNPKKLFEFLLSLSFDFRFYIYTVKGLQDSYSCITPYVNRFGNKLIVMDSIPRLDLIEQLSSADFLINLSNNTSNQIPSKLIDYALANRPIFSCTSDVVDSEKFLQFCQGNYSGREHIKIEDYDIKQVVAKFKDIMRK